MAYTLTLNQQVKQQVNLKQNQLLMMLPQMQQGIHILQLPVMELSTLIEEEIEKNPILELDALHKEDEEQKTEPSSENEPSFGDQDASIVEQLEDDCGNDYSEKSYSYKKQSEDGGFNTFLENSIAAPTTLFAHLLLQAQDSFDDTDDLRVAEIIIGNISDHGYLTTSLEEMATMAQTNREQIERLLKEIETFEPYGIGARTIQQSLLTQLRCLGKEKSLAYTILEQHYENLIHNHLPAIQKSLKCSFEEIRTAIETHIAKLDLHPGTSFRSSITQAITPDVHIHAQGEKFLVEVNEDSLPAIRTNPYYLKMLNDERLATETKGFIQQHLLSANWLAKSIRQRNETIARITSYLTKSQKEFFLSHEGQLRPLTMKEIAQELELHESTIARAVANKYVSSPRGLLSLRSFFTTAYKKIDGTALSSKTVQQAIEQIIKKENKKEPLSDDAISAALRDQGMICARRTVAKHRRTLNLANRNQRRRF